MGETDRFQPRSGRYKCRSCGKMTRETGEGESDIELCLKCFNDAGDENEKNDGIMPWELHEHVPGDPDKDGDVCCTICDLVLEGKIKDEASEILKIMNKAGG